MSQTKAELIEPQGNVAFDTNTLYVDASNNRVGIGTTSPVAPLHVANAIPVLVLDETDGTSTHNQSWLLRNGNEVQLQTRNSTGTYVSVDYISAGSSTGATSHQWFIQNTERARIDSSGRLLVGTSSALGTTSRLLEVANNIAISSYIGNQFAYELTFNKSRGSTNGTIVQNGDTIGNITFRADDGTDTDSVAAAIRCDVDGTPGANDMPGRLVFSTTADGASSPTERMRIGNNGHVNVGQSGSGLENNRSFSFQTTGAGQAVFNHSTANNTGDAWIVFGYNSNSIGSITQNGTTGTLYNTTSDYRLKENVAAVTDGVARLQQLRPSRFNFIAEPSRIVDGFIAHEVQAVVPEAVTGAKDEVDDDGNPIYQGIDQSKLVPLLTAALQEAIGEIESLKARVAALESA